jgi:hypothetical protein
LSETAGSGFSCLGSLVLKNGVVRFVTGAWQVQNGQKSWTGSFAAEQKI